MPGGEEKGGIVTASNFKMFPDPKGDNLYLKLVGDFDGTSACELLNVMKEKCNSADRVYIDTSSLEEIYPFGHDTFQNNLYVLKAQPSRFVFTGKNATEIAPEGSKFCRIL